jgi:hypothetical protein
MRMLNIAMLTLSAVLSAATVATQQLSNEEWLVFNPALELKRADNRNALVVHQIKKLHVKFFSPFS